MNFPSKSSGEESEQIQCVVADIFLRRLIIHLHSLNFVLVAFVADVFFWVARKRDCGRNVNGPVFRLFCYANIGVALGSAAASNADGSRGAVASFDRCERRYRVSRTARSSSATRSRTSRVGFVLLARSVLTEACTKSPNYINPCNGKPLCCTDRRGRGLHDTTDRDAVGAVHAVHAGQRGMGTGQACPNFTAADPRTPGSCCRARPFAPRARLAQPLSPAGIWRQSTGVSPPSTSA